MKKKKKRTRKPHLLGALLRIDISKRVIWATGFLLLSSLIPAFPHSLFLMYVRAHTQITQVAWAPLSTNPPREPCTVCQ